MRIERALKFVLFSLLLSGCASPPPVSDGTSAALNIQIDSKDGDAILSLGPRPSMYNSFTPQTEIASNLLQQGKISASITIPADQEDEFTFLETFGKLPLECNLHFKIRALPEQRYLFIVGDIPPTPKGTNPAAEIAHVLEAGDVPRCYIKRFTYMPDGSLKPFPFNDATFEPSAVLR